MSPVPIIERQRALTQIGEIRTGGEKQKNKPGAKLEAFRFTSEHQDIIERVPPLYGGEVKPWDAPSGPAWQVESTASALPVKVVVGYSLRLSYELWSGMTKHERSCDGVTEALGEQPCVCNATGKDECGIVTRLKVMLPQLGTFGAWRLTSGGETAARELAGAMDLAEMLAQGRPLLDATLRLTQRRSVVDGQTVRFVVPVLDFDPEVVTDAAYAALPRTSVEGGVVEMKRRSERAVPIGPAAPLPEPQPWPEPTSLAADAELAEATSELLALAGEIGGDMPEMVPRFMEENRASTTDDEHLAWLRKQIEAAHHSLAARRAGT